MEKLNLPKTKEAITKEAIDKFIEAAIMVETWRQNEECFKTIGWSLDDKGRVEFIIELEKYEDEFEKRNNKNNEIIAKLIYKKKKEIEE